MLDLRRTVQRFIVYCHTNKVNGKKYVGITKHSMKHRWLGHLRAAKYRKNEWVFCKAIRKYGQDGFTHEVLDVTATLKGAKAAERVWICQKQSRVPRGYNLTSGGEHPKHHARSVRKISAAATTQWAKRTPDQRQAVTQKGVQTWISTSTPKQRQEIARRAAMSRPLEERREAMRIARSALTPEQRSEKQRRCALKMWSKKTPEERQAIALRRTSSEPAAKRRARGLKAWQSRSAESQQEAAQRARETISRVTLEQRREYGRRSWITRRERLKKEVE